MTLIAHLSTLESAGLVRVAQVIPELEYLFRHTLVQEAAYASLLQTDRRQLHLAVGEILERVYPDRLDELAPRLAQHFAAAGDEQRALRYYTKAGAAALASYANPEAEDHYRHALALGPSDVERADLLYGLGEALSRQDRSEEAIRTWREGIVLYQAMGDSDGVARLYARSARTAWYGGDTPGGLRLCEEGLATVEGAPESPDIARLLHEAARAYHFNGLPDQACPFCHRALEMAERLGAVDVQADALATLGILPGVPPEEALQALEKAVELSESAGLLQIASRAHQNLGVMKRGLLGDQEAGRAHFLRAAELGRQRGVATAEILSLFSAAAVSLWLGDLKTVEEMLPQLEQLQSLIADPGAAASTIHLMRAVLAQYRGEWEEALALMRDGLAEARRCGDLQMVFELGCDLAALLMEFDEFQSLADWGEAEAAALQAIEVSERGLGGGALPRSLLGMIRVRQGRLEDARHLLAEAREVTSSQRGFWKDVAIATVEANLANVEERWPDALAAFEEAVTRSTQLKARWWSGRLLQAWAEVHVSRDQPADVERAQTLLREALAIFEEMGATYYARRVADRLQSLRTLSYARALDLQQVTEEMAKAREVQEGLLPAELPRVPGWQVAAVLQPARQTSGDFYDLIDLPEGRLGIVVADVAEKGAGAALYMALSRTLIRTYAAEYAVQPEQVLLAANERILADTHTDMFVTLFYGVLEPRTGTLHYANAGHNPPFLFRARGEGIPEVLIRTGPPLGILDEVAWTQEVVQISLGDLLVLYTDGVTEAQNAAQAFFGDERVREIGQANLGRPAQEVQEALLAATREFVGDAPQFDDITVMVIARSDG